MKSGRLLGLRFDLLAEQSKGLSDDERAAVGIPALLDLLIHPGDVLFAKIEIDAALWLGWLRARRRQARSPKLSHQFILSG